MRYLTTRFAASITLRLGFIKYLDSTLTASEIWIEAAPGGSLASELTIRDGAPRVHINGLQVAGSIRVAADGVEMIDGWSHEGLGVIAFDEAPGAGVVLTAGYRFDVPVRFAEDRLEISRATFAAGEAVSVPLVEIRE